MRKPRAFLFPSLFILVLLLPSSCLSPSMGGGDGSKGLEESRPFPGTWTLAPGVDLKVVRGEGEKGFRVFLSERGPLALERSPGGGWWVPPLGMEVSFLGTKGSSRVVVSRFGERAFGAEEKRGEGGGEAGDLPVLERLKRWIPAWMILHDVPGVSLAVIRRRRLGERLQFGLLASNAPWKVREGSLFEACSMSKPLFTYAVLKLVEEGRLDLDRPLDSYLPSPYLPGQKWSGLVTARMVLTHRTGLPNWRKGGWLGGGALRFLCRPGSRFTYSGEGFTWLQTVVERITRTPLDVWMEKMALRPMGMALSSYRWKRDFESVYAHGHDKKGRLKNRPHYFRPNCAFSLYTTPTEYARFLLTIMDPHPSRPWQLRPETRDLMLHGNSPGREGTFRSLGFALRPVPGGVLVEHGGSNGAGFRCFSFFDPRGGSGLVVMTNSDSGRALYLRVLETLEPRYSGLAGAGSRP